MAAAIGPAPEGPPSPLQGVASAADPVPSLRFGSGVSSKTRTMNHDYPVTQLPVPKPGGVRPAPAPGDRIGRWQVVQPLGTGGAAHVIEVRCRRSGQRAAMKLLRRRSHASTQVQAQFESERGILTRLGGAGVPRFLDAGRSPDFGPWVAMERIEGLPMDLRLSAIRRSGCDAHWPLRRRLAAWLSLTDTVSLVHDKGVVHRDLKPANILVRPDGTTALVDWGLGLDKRNPPPHLAAMKGRAYGTPGYLAPEQAAGGFETFEPRTDVFGLAAVLYELLTLRRPWKSAGVLEALDAPLTPPPVPCSDRFGRPLPAFLGFWCMRALRPQIAERPPVAALRDAVLRFVRVDMNPARPARVA